MPMTLIILAHMRTKIATNNINALVKLPKAALAMVGRVAQFSGDAFNAIAEVAGLAAGTPPEAQAFTHGAQRRCETGTERGTWHAHLHVWKV